MRDHHGEKGGKLCGIHLHRERDGHVGIFPDMAENFVEFICTGNGTVMSESFQICKGAKVNIAWMGNRPASEYLSRGYYWANLSIDYMKQNGGERTVEEFYDAGIEFSVYNADDDDTMDYYISRADKMKAICTNYPKKLLRKME